MKLATTPFTLALIAITLPASLVIVAGCLRYGGPNQFIQRVQIEIAHNMPHEVSVPTPLPGNSQLSPAQAARLTVNSVVIAEPITTSSLISETVADAPLLLPTATPEGIVEEPQLAEPADEISQSAPQPLHQPSLPAVELTGLRHEWQTWNNCGPATLSFYMSYYGNPLMQADTGAQLRHNPDDKNVLPFELSQFAQNQGYLTSVRVNGNLDLLRSFLSNGIPVIIETWLEEEPNDGMGHYRLLTGYDDAGQYWIAYDSYVTRDLLNPNGAYRGIRLPYAETDALWKVFNRTFVLVYPQEKQELVASIFGEALAQPMQSNIAALEQARAELASNPNDAFAWFNLGSMLVTLNYPAQAADAFDNARRLGLPWRMLWYQFEPFSAYYQVGRFQEVVALADATLRNVDSIEEIFYWKGMGLAALGDRDGAIEAWRAALRLNSNYTPAITALGM